jgi:hypothetical protein
MNPQFWGVGRSAGLFLFLSVIANGIGVVMFWIRGGHRGGPPPTHTYFVWERGSIMAAITLAAIGFVLLEGPLEGTGGHVLARVGATAYLFAGVLGVVAEALGLSWNEPRFNPYPLMAVYVVVAFLAQAAIAGALLQSGLLATGLQATWIGWVMILWNLVWLAVLPVVSRRDIYFPVLHHFMPLLIGIALLWGAPLL